MVRTLGVNCDPHTAYLAVVEDGAVVDCGSARERLHLPTDDFEALNALLDEAVQLIKALRVVGVSILQAESTGPGGKKKQASLAKRTAMETAMGIAAVRAGVSSELTPRATVRTRLGCPQQGNLGDYLGSILPKSVGHYWRDGRGLAALAALALGKVHAT